MLEMAVAMPLTDAKRPGSDCTSDSLPTFISSSVNGISPCTPLKCVMNPMSALSLFALTMPPPARNAPGPRPYAKLEFTP